MLSKSIQKLTETEQGIDQSGRLLEGHMGRWFNILHTYCSNIKALESASTWLYLLHRVRPVLKDPHDSHQNGSVCLLGFAQSVSTISASQYYHTTLWTIGLRLLTRLGKGKNNVPSETETIAVRSAERHRNRILN
jgi:hypothetical protein